MLDGILGWVLGVVEGLGYLGVAGLLALETFFPPIPSEAVLPLAGFLAGQGKLDPFLVVAAATVGSTLGSLSLYAVGRWLGDERLRALIEGPGRWLLLRVDDLDRAEEWFERHGRAAVFLGRLVPFLRSAVSVPAGVERMPVLQFTVYTAAGSAIWNGVLVALGWWLGQNWQAVGEYLRYFQWVVLAAAAVGVAWYAYRRLSREKASGSPG